MNLKMLKNQSSLSQHEVSLATGDIWKCLVTFQFLTFRVGEWWAPDGQRSRMLSVLCYTGQLPKTALCVSSVEADKHGAIESDFLLLRLKGTVEEEISRTQRVTVGNDYKRLANQAEKKGQEDDYFDQTFQLFFCQ